MKKLVLFILLILFLIFSISARVVAEKKFNVQEGKKLEVNLKSGGSIDVSGWNKKVAHITAYCRNGDMDDMVNIVQTEEGIEVTSYHSGERRSCSLELKVNVPVKFDLILKTMGGEVSINNVEGDISGRTMGGSLELSSLRGEIQFKTMGGDITLKDSDVDGQVKTMGGRVLLEDVVGDIKGSSMGGNVVYKNVKTRNGKSTGKVVKISTMGGSINVKSAPEGADVHTMGGDIRIKSAEEFIKAKTMGGKIRIDEINGGVDATTMGGDIEVNMTGNPKKGKRDVFLTSMGGDITLSVPKSLSMDIDIEIRYTRDSFKKYKIYSDFKIETRESKVWEERSGNVWKILSGKGKTGNGKHKIRISTVNGNVYLKKNR